MESRAATGLFSGTRGVVLYFPSSLFLARDIVPTDQVDVCLEIGARA